MDELNYLKSLNTKESLILAIYISDKLRKKNNDLIIYKRTKERIKSILHKSTIIFSFIFLCGIFSLSTGINLDNSDKSLYKLYANRLINTGLFTSLFGCTGLLISYLLIPNKDLLKEANQTIITNEKLLDSITKEINLFIPNSYYSLGFRNNLDNFEVSKNINILDIINEEREKDVIGDNLSSIFEDENLHSNLSDE